MISERRDGRGHWPSGKRRSDITRAQHDRVLAVLRVLLGRNWSRRRIAQRLAVSDRAVRRWLAGDDWPQETSARRVEALAKAAHVKMRRAG
jgi:ribosome-binding protein aMBF1 (putative translation factor)